MQEVGNGILKQLSDANINIEDITDIFVSHIHSDHILGVFWIIRVISRKYVVEGYEKEHFIYGNNQVIDSLREITQILLPQKFVNYLDTKIKLVKVKDGESIKIYDKKCTFFETQSTDVKQFGFYMNLSDKNKFTFIGDESCSENTKQYVKNSEWLFADAYKPELEDAEIGKRYRHSTVRFVAELSQKLNVKNIILSHSLDNDLKNRKNIFTNVAKKYFDGNVFVPNDLDVIYLN